MNKKVFRAGTMHEAMASVKEDLGPDAMILSTRKVPRKPRDPYAGEMFEVEAALHPDPDPGEKNGENMDALKRELDSIKDMISLAGFGYGMHNILCDQAGSVKLFASLLRSGISDKKAFSIIHKACYEMREDQNRGGEVTSLKKYVMEECIKWIEAKDCFTRENNAGVPHVAAFAGPTGVGKTTTIAKLAACLSIKKRKRVGLISVDNYRIGAFEQLKAYAAIMGLYCIQAYSSEDLACALDRMKALDIVLVDTAGHSHLDRERMDELIAVINGEFKTSVHLVLSVTTDFSNMKEAADAFSVLKPDTYVFTKTDETKMCGRILDQLSERKLPVSLITNGQRVPEDLVVPDKRKLLNVIFGREQEERLEERSGGRA